jgi:aryl-alcohol dehydrogenase-like predicted oxidoreductase
MPAKTAKPVAKKGGRSAPASPATPSARGVRASAIEPLPMGNHGATHPGLGLGLWSLGRWFPEDEQRTRAVLAHAFELDLPWLDTAEVYGGGRSERMLGDLLAGRPPGSPVPFISTKLSWEHLRPSQIRPSVLGSRQRLGLPKLDLYLVHAPDPHVPIKDTMQALEALWKAGDLKAIGVSNFSLEQLEAAQAALTETEIVANQVRFSLLERDEADPLLEYCHQHRIVVEAYSPTARGLLAGRFLDGKGPPKGDVRAGHGLFTADTFPVMRERARKIRELALKEKVPMLALALHGLRRAGAAPVLGASRPEQLDEALAAWQSAPSGRVVQEAERIGRGDAD